MAETILERIRRIAADLLDVPFQKLLPSSCPEEIESWDSLNHLNLVLGLEGEFGVQFSPEEIAGMQTVADIAALVQKRLALD